MSILSLKNNLKNALNVVDYVIWSICDIARKRKSNKIKRILVVNLAFIGDVLATTPLIGALSKNFKVDVIALPSTAMLLQGNESINKTIICKDYTGLKSIGRNNYYSAILIYPNDFRTIKCLINAGVKEIIGFSSHKDIGSRSNLGKMLLNFDNRPKVMQNLSALKALAIDAGKINPIDFRMNLTLSKEEINNVSKKFKLRKGFVVLSSGSRSQKKLGIVFPDKEKFLSIAEYLSEVYNKDIIIVGAEEDSKFGEYIKTKFKFPGKIKNLTGKTNLRELGAILKLSDLLIGVDSGTVHIASTQNTKIIDLIRNSQAKIWSPWMKKERYKLLVSRGENLNNIKIKEIKGAIEEMLR